MKGEIMSVEYKDGEAIAVVKFTQQLSETMRDSWTGEIKSRVEHAMVDHCSQAMIEAHAEEILKSIDLQAIKNAVILSTTRRLTNN